ncbi:MAG: c-type cytochrome [Sandaracinaceae bacterium]
MDRLKRIGKWVAVASAVGLVALVGLVVASSVAWSSRLGARYETREHDFAIPELTDENRAEAERLYVSRGCGECHGADGGGRALIDAPPFLINPPNITSMMRALSPTDLHALVRRGVRPDGSPVFFMPAVDYARMPDAELGLITAYVRALPESDAQHAPSELRALGKVLAFVGALDFPVLPAEVIDQSAPFEPVGPDEMGEYIALGCRGCHGERMSGGPIPGAPVESVGIPPNLTPHASGLAGWTLEEFALAMREGRTPRGTLNPDFMPFRTYRHLDDAEMASLFAYLQTLEPVDEGHR